MSAEIGNLVIRYDGLDADRHVVEMSALADSLKGLSRIIGVTSTFAATQKVINHSDARPLRVVVGPPEAKCLVLNAALQWLDQHAFIGATVSGLTVILISYVFKRAAGQREEMKHLQASLETAIKELGNRDQGVIARLLDTIDGMADNLKPAARQAVKPVGVSAATMTIAGATGSTSQVVVDAAMKAAIDAGDSLSVGDEVAIRVRFSEMNWDTRTCKVALESASDERQPAEITDPEIQIPNNAYATAFASQSFLSVRAKPTLRGDHIDRWYISAHE